MTDYRSNADFFDGFAGNYREAVRRSQSFLPSDPDRFCRGKALELIRLIQQHLGDPDRLAALDVGCGIGELDEFLTGRLGTLHGVDISGESVALAAKRNPAAEYLAYGGERLPYEEGRFDVAFAVCVLHHVPPQDWRAFLAEMARVVRPGGLVVVFEHNPWNPLTRLAVGRCELDEEAVLVSRPRVESLFQGVFLVPIGSHFLFFDPFGLPLLAGLERRLGWLPIGAQFVAVGRKPLNRATHERADSNA